jgi:hypothetical protein
MSPQPSRFRDSGLWSVDLEQNQLLWFSVDIRKREGKFDDAIGVRAELASHELSATELQHCLLPTELRAAGARAS